MVVSYFKSKDIKIFPATFRGNYSQETITRVFDPEAKFNSEYNYTHLPGRVLNAKSIILDTNYFTLAANDSISITESESCYIHFVLDGYYFEISGAELFDILKKAKDLTLAIATRTTTIVEEGGIDNKRDLHYLTSYHYGDSVSLDSLMSIPGSMFSDYRCTAIAAETDEYKIPSCPGDDIIGTASHASREDSSRTILQIKASGKFCYKNFASNLVPAYCQNYAVYLNSNGAEPANLEVGYEASATESGAVAIGPGAKANGKDVIAIGDNAKAELTAQSTSTAAIALGSAAIAANNSIVIGSASATDTAVGNAVVVGQESITKRSGSVLIGKGIQDTSAKEGIIAVGEGAKVHADESNSVKIGAVTIGNSAEGKDAATVAVGPRSKAMAPGAIALGADAEANQDFAISIGEDATSLVAGDITIGRGINNPSSRTYQRTIIGQYNDEIKDGSFVIATGTSSSNKKTSCTFNTKTSNDSGTVVYENFTVKPDGSNVKLNISGTSTKISTAQITIDGKLDINAAGLQKGVTISGNTKINGILEVANNTKLCGDLDLQGDVELAATKTLSTDNIKVSKIQPRSVDKSLELATNLDKIKVYKKDTIVATSMVQLWFDMAHPVNSIFQTVDPDLSSAEKVEIYFESKYGVASKWIAWAEGKVPVGANDAFEVNTTGGKSSVTIKEQNLPSHTHTVSIDPHDSQTLSFNPSIPSNTNSVNLSHSHNTNSSGTHAHTFELFTDRGDAEYPPSSEALGANQQKGTWRTTEIRHKYTDGAHSHSTNSALSNHSHTYSLAHSHTLPKYTHTASLTSAGSDNPEVVSIIQPYQVCYMYRRIS